MKTLTCAATRRRLQAFHDDELPVADQIAVGAHLEWCEPCASSYADLRMLRAMVRSVARDRLSLSDEESLSLQRGIVEQARAELDTSWSALLGSMFEDMRLVYAGLGATLAAVACLTMMLNMMRFTTERHPSSLAARIDALATPEVIPESRGPVVIEARLITPHASGAAFAADFDTLVTDAEYALTAVLTKDGRVQNVELVNMKSGQAVARGSDEARAFGPLMGAVARARYKPASVDGLPVAVNKVWLVANTTVHASKDVLDPPASPGAKKRVTTRRSTDGSSIA